MAKKGEIIAHADFPLYLVRTIDSTHFLVAGGGGSAKTGVGNALVIYEVSEQNGACSAEPVCKHETGEEAVMNGVVISEARHNTLAAGLNDTCHLYQIHCRVETRRGDQQEGIRRRRTNRTESKDHDRASKTVAFDITEIDRVQTDLPHKGNPGFQKAIAFTNDCSLIVTAGADGHIRTWRYPSLEKLYEIQAHSDEIDDIHISSAGDKICSVSRDHSVSVWQTADGTRVCDLQWPVAPKKEFRARCCRYSKVSDRPGRSVLFTAHIPAVRGAGSQTCHLTKWDTASHKVTFSRRTGAEILSTMAVSNEGHFVAVGTISGSVSVYTALRLQCLYNVREVHSIFVTSLDFAPPEAAWSKSEFSLLSVSADNQVRLHQLDPPMLTRLTDLLSGGLGLLRHTLLWPLHLLPNTYSMLWAVVGFLALIYLLFWFMAYLGV